MDFKNFRETFSRLGSLKADGSGISMEFQSAIEEVTQLGQETGLLDVAKSSISINGRIKPKNPQLQLHELHMNIKDRLHKIASDNGMDPTGMTNTALFDAYKRTGILPQNKINFIKKLDELTSSRDSRISQGQVDHLRSLWNSAQI